MNRKMNKLNRVAVILASLYIGLSSGAAQATRFLGFGDFIFPNGVWTQIASDCSPDEASINPVRTGSGVSLPSATTGTVTLRCNIANVMDEAYPWNALEVVYKDSDGSGTADQVTASLHKVGLNAQSESRLFTPITAGNITLPVDPSLLAVFDSNQVASVTNTAQTHHINVNHSFDFAENAYYVLVKVKRSDLSRNPGVFVVRLFAKGNIGG
ncbi:MAG: hypothetical protein IPN42_06825 [Methylococcaceae bacterium]|nr:hypothetical protein [Methylococcaceae bacterium]